MMQQFHSCNRFYSHEHHWAARGQAMVTIAAAGSSKTNPSFGHSHHMRFLRMRNSIGVRICRSEDV